MRLGLNWMSLKRSFRFGFKRGMKRIRKYSSFVRRGVSIR